MATNREMPIPKRWLYCPRKSESVIAERFLAFKTPLSAAYKDQMPVDCVFTPEMLFGYMKALKIKLGLWIDLTNTKRFYDRAAVDEGGAKYIKMQCRGHGETPSAEQTQSFIEIVDSFINERPLDIIGVHCTHGFNRTGFLIVSYMVERMDCSVEAALALFAAARPPGIYKQDYIQELFRRYEDEEDATLAPELPEWCNEYDDSNAGGSNTANKRQHEHNNAASTSAGGGGGQDEDDVDDENDAVDNDDDDGSGNTNGGRPRKRRRGELVIKNATFMAGVPGTTLVTDQPRLGELQKRVQKMCNWKKGGFPGSQPVSMDCNNISLLHKMPYKVSWKADGTRYMMLIHKKSEIYFFDRNNSCFQVENLTFVNARNPHEHLENTLLDGEMVLDKFQGQTYPRYLIYDIIQFGAIRIGEKAYEKRLSCIQHEIIQPRIEAMKNGIIKRAHEPFSVRIKDFWDIDQAERLLGESFAKNLAHEPDGLIFQPAEAPYTAGQCPDVLKWKPSDMNSVDFRLKIGKESGQGILTRKIGYLFVGGHDTYFARIKYTKDLQGLDNKIIECTFNNNQWEFMRERTDKVMPNSFNTANAVINSIRNPITKEILLNFIAQYGYRHTREIMPPPKQKPNLRHSPPLSHQQQLQHRLQQQQHHQQHHRQPQQLPQRHQEDHFQHQDDNVSEPQHVEQQQSMPPNDTYDEQS